MQKVIKINEQVISTNYKTFLRFESLIISISSSYGMLNKFTTGFGWHQNLIALEKRRIINPPIAKEIEESVNYLRSIQFRYEIGVDEWNQYVLKSQSLINYLSEIA